MNEPRMFEPARRVPKAGVQGNYAGQQAAVPTRPALAQDFDPLDITKSATGFDYKGIDSLGVAISGFVQTTDMDLAQKELRRAGVEVTSIVPRKMMRQKAKKPSMLEFAQLADQFGDLMEIGENPVQVCRLLAYSQTNRHLQEALLSIGEKVMNGWSLSESFSSIKDDK